ncbi:MAG: periplasmic heavy metal sensor [Deltaproteobacteria bacterium]|nr:periplasmic heavy metal sensor [Deltaproteobacteria bacterium]
MKRFSVTGIVLVIVSIIYVSTVWCSEQQGPGQSASGSSDTGKKASAGMMSPKKTEKMDKMHEMVGKMVDKAVQEKMMSMREEFCEKKEAGINKGAQYHQKGGIGAYALMRPFHQWMACLMCRQESLNLTAGQKEDLDNALTGHLKAAIRARAEARALQIDLKHSLRKEPLDLPSMEKQVQKLIEQETSLMMEGIKLYKEVLGVLNAAQRAQVEETIGSPFPPPWKDMPQGLCGGEGPAEYFKSSRKTEEREKKMHGAHHQ